MAENSVRISVRVDDDTAAGMARVRASIDAMGRQSSARLAEHGRQGGDRYMRGLSGSIGAGAPAVGARLGSSLGGGAAAGISEGGQTGLRALVSNPYVLTAGVAIGTVLAGAIATLIGGAIILALGGAFTAIGVMALAGSKKSGSAVRKEWKETGHYIKKQIEDASAPLLPVLHEAAKVAKHIVDVFAPVFKSAFTKVAPIMTSFVKALGDAVEKFKPAIGPIMKAFGALLTALTPVVGQVATDLSDAFTNLANVFAKKQNAKAFANLVKLILELATVDVVNGIAAESDAFGRLDKALSDLNKATGGTGLKALGDFLKFCLKGLFIAPLNNTAAAIEFIAKSINTSKAAFKWFSEWLGKLKSKAVTLTVKGVPTATRLVQSVINWIKKFLGKSVTLSVKGVSAALKAVQSVIDRIKHFVGKTVTVSVKAVVSGITSTVKKLLGLAHGGVVGSSGFAHGGYVGKADGGGPRSNRTLVGENGPEIVDLAPGSHVRSNADSRRLMSEGGGGGRVVLEFVAPPGSVEAALFEIFRKGIRVRGGNVQAVLGRN